MLLGVITLQSCTSYRIKAVKHDQGAVYYFPQKRIFVGDWNDIKTYDGDYSRTWAKSVIQKDKNPQQKQITFIKDKDL